MASQVTPIKDLELWFADLITNLLNLNEDHVLIQYATQGQPSSKITENYAYVRISPEVDTRQIYKNRRMVYDESSGTRNIVQFSQRTLTLGIIFYGPSCVDNATIFSEMLYLPEQKLALDQKGLSLVPDRTDGPLRVPEFHNGQWFERADLELRFYEQVQVSEDVQTFEDVDIRMEVDK